MREDPMIPVEVNMAYYNAEVAITSALIHGENVIIMISDALATKNPRAAEGVRYQF